MKTIELWFGKWDSPSIFFNILSIEFEIVPKITSLNELEMFYLLSWRFQCANSFR